MLAWSIDGVDHSNDLLANWPSAAYAKEEHDTHHSAFFRPLTSSDRTNPLCSRRPRLLHLLQAGVANSLGSVPARPIEPDPESQTFEKPTPFFASKMQRRIQALVPSSRSLPCVRTWHSNSTRISPWSLGSFSKKIIQV
ncbi:hypothetical protein L210DRAFT_175468, partial [Boletus edulis BED1]